MPNNDYILTENFTLWLITMRRALRDNKGMNVPCGNCFACCTSSYIINVHSDEKETLRAVPHELLIDTYGSPGTKALKSDTNGHCLLMKENKCLIYENRPWACRTYDCRLLSAAGLSESADKTKINTQIKKWTFSFSDDVDHENYNAVQKAAHFIVTHIKDFPSGYISTKPVQQAVAAVKIFELFIESDNHVEEKSSTHLISEIVKAIKKFDS